MMMMMSNNDNNNNDDDNDNNNYYNYTYIHIPAPSAVLRPPVCPRGHAARPQPPVITFDRYTLGLFNVAT